MFLAAGAYKLSDLGEFAGAVRHYRLIPGATAGAVARTVALTESALGTALLIGAGIRMAAGVGSLLLIVFALAMAINLIRGRQIPCGCKRDSEPIQIKHIVRNLAGVGAMFYLAGAAVHPWSLDALMR